ncbi:MAG: BatA domain-containing protein [Acidobacteriota bacterium]
MGLSFLSPAFLLGAVALAIPIWIHLTHREKRVIVDFPSLMFLHRIPYRSVRRQKIRHWLLFLLRCLALALLVGSFARPFLDRAGEAAGASGGAREVVVLLDRSYSMEYGNRWERALDAARQAVGNLAPEERATLVVFSERAEALDQPTSDGARLKAALEGLEVSSETTRFVPALKLAKKLVEDSKLPRKEVVLISDFQKGGWNGQEHVTLPEGTVVRAVDLSEAVTSNLSVTSVVFERESLSGRERVVASARITNQSAGPFENVGVRLELNGRSLQEKRTTVEPNSSVTLRFEPFTLPEGVSRGVVRVEDDALPRDNRFYFVLWPGQSLSVLLLRGPGDARGSLYLRRALSIGERPSFRVEVKRLNRLEGSDLEGSVVVIANDVASPGEAVGLALVEFVRAGGGLLIVLGEASGSSGWDGAAAGLLPSGWGKAVDRSADWGGTLAYIDYGHPVFELFNAPYSGDFSPAKFFRYRRVEALAGDRVLARFDDGSPALMEKKLGDGRILLWTSTLDRFWNDLAIQPVFLPFVHQLVKYAAGYAEAKQWHEVSEVIDLSSYLEMAGIGNSGVHGSPNRAGGPFATELVAIKPSGAKTILSGAAGEERPLFTLNEQGFYDLRYAGETSSPPVTLAANLDVAESDLSTLDPEELVVAISPRGSEGVGEAPVEWTAEDQEDRQRFWWYLLAAAFVLLAAETAFSNRLSRA